MFFFGIDSSLHAVPHCSTPITFFLSMQNRPWTFV